MSRDKDKLTLGWLLRHPLVATCILLALTVLLPMLRVGERLKLIPFLPAVYAEDGEVVEDGEELTPEQRLRRDLKRAREDVARLSDERDSLRRSLNRVNLLESGSDGFSVPGFPQAVAARVIFRGDASGWRHSCVLNRGRKHGVEEGMPVVDGRTLIGRTFLVSEKLSYVQLITDPAFAASCIILDPRRPPQDSADRVRGVLRGDGSARPHFPRLELEDVAAGAPVVAGMIVVTSDFAGNYPLGLWVGTVREVIPQSGFLQVRIEAGLDLSRLEVVQILLHRRPAIESQAIKLLRGG